MNPWGSDQIEEVIVKETRSSYFAEVCAAWRAAESIKPQDERVCYEPLAKYFIRTPFRILTKSRFLAEIAFWYSDRRFPGAAGELLARTRYIDDYLKARIDDGIAQLVILGAGFDTRAYRFDGLKGNVKVFEVDHPATQKVKTETINRIFGSLPENIIYVPIDFEKESLSVRLLESCYNKNLKTLFIWDGVTMYLSAEAVDETLGFVTKNSGKGSSIIFDYIFKSVVDGTCELKEAKKARKCFRRTDEHLLFGIEEGSIEEFLCERGFYQVKNVTSDFLKDTYFKGINRRRSISPLLATVHATVHPGN
jgi:methyltransferase (TIGR00027 family)